MNQKELRLGNFVCSGKNEDGSDDIVMVCHLKTKEFDKWNGSSDYNSIDVEVAGKYYWSSKITPIPLTEDWLKKFSFEKEKNKIDIFFKGRLRVYLGARGQCLIYLIEEDTTTGHCIPNTIEYVHTLQNLYYCLYGKELEIIQ